MTMHCKTSPSGLGPAYGVVIVLQCSKLLAICCRQPQMITFHRWPSIAHAKVKPATEQIANGFAPGFF